MARSAAKPHVSNHGARGHPSRRRDAISRAIPTNVAVFALIFDARDEAAARFYRHHGVQAFSGRRRGCFCRQRRRGLLAFVLDNLNVSTVPKAQPPTFGFNVSKNCYGRLYLMGAEGHFVFRLQKIGTDRFNLSINYSLNGNSAVKLIFLPA
jgi:hypothetical protein